jgi:membrane-bound lytic murein transglycosylase A
LSLLPVLLLAACVTAPPPPKPPPVEGAGARIEPVPWSSLPGFLGDRMAEAWPAFLVGCRKLAAGASTAPTWRTPCEAAAAVDANDEAAVRAFFAGHFKPYRVTAADGQDQGLVTGYFEPRLSGSRERTATFNVPLYGRPDDLLVVDLADLHPELKGRRVRGRVDGQRVVPYWSRSDIEAGRATSARKAIAWVADPLDAFFLEVQGSGRLDLADGSVMRVGYADQNGHPYRAIARVLVDRGEITLEESSMQAIRAWARANPDRVRALLDENPSYVFFREVTPPPPGSLEAQINGPIGSLGVPLSARRSIAVDPRAVPLGAPVWIATTHPLTEAPLERLVMAQDTGGAIRGAVRADFYWGAGDEAGEHAGRMRQRGRMWMLWPVGAPLPGAS